jgi:hypothetical protein
MEWLQMKRLKIRKWLELNDAAAAASGMIGEPIQALDLIRAAIEGQLRLSVHLVNGQYAKFFDPVSIEDADAMLVPVSPDESPLTFEYPDDAPRFGRAWQLRRWLDSPAGAAVKSELVPAILSPTDETGEQFLRSKRAIESIDGIWDLARVGNGLLDLEQLYQAHIGGPKVTGTFLDGVWVISSTESRYAMLQERLRESTTDSFGLRDENDYIPLAALNFSEAPLVVRTDELSRWVAELSEGSSTEAEADGSQEVASESPKSQWKRERNNILKVLLALDGMAKLPVKAAEAVIRRELELINVDNPPSEQTIRKFISEARAMRAN